MPDVDGSPYETPDGTIPGSWASSIVNGGSASYDKAARAGTAVLAALDRALPVLRQVVRGVRVFAWSGIVAAVTITVSFLLVVWAPTTGAAVFLAILGVVLAVPAVV